MNQAKALSAIERAKSRYTQLKLSALASAAAKALSIGTALISVPLTLGYLGTERYGMWLTLSGFASMLTFADLGIGAGVTNAVSTADGSDDHQTIRAIVASGIAILSGVAMLILLVLAATYRMVDWAAFFNVKSALARAEAGPALATFIVCLALALPVSLVERLQAGVQRSFMASLWRCLGSIASLVAVLVAIWLNAGLFWLVLAYSGVPVLITLINSAVFFAFIAPSLRPRILHANLSSARFIAQDGTMFFLIQILTGFAKYSDNLVIAHILGATAVPLFAVPEKLFAQISGTAFMGLWPLLPAYREARARGDHHWVRVTLMKSLRVTLLLAGLSAAVLVAIGPWLIALWTHDVIHPTWALLIGLALWKVSEACSFAPETYLIGAGKLRLLALCWAVLAMLIVPLKFLIVPVLGVTGAVWTTVVLFAACILIPWLQVSLRDARSLEVGQTV
jgi:O-antigen/teichoic acid export membrane protein